MKKNEKKRKKALYDMELIGFDPKDYTQVEFVKAIIENMNME